VGPQQPKANSAMAGQAQLGQLMSECMVRHSVVVETRQGLVENGLRRTGYQTLHEDLNGVAGNSKLTGEACSLAEDDNIGGESREVDEEMINRQAPQLHRKDENVRWPLTSDEHHQKECSPSIGG
jgi:hypothetical protein